MDSKIVENAMYNTYNLLMGHCTKKELLGNVEHEVVMEINPHTVKCMIRYFEDLEEYEMCSEMVKKLS